MATLYDVFRVFVLDGGMATSYSTRLLDAERGYSRLLKNFDVSMPGLLKKRPGMKASIDNGVEMTTANPVTGLHEFVKLSTEQKFTLMAQGTVVQRRSAGAWVDVVTGLTSGLPVEFLTIADQVVMTNGVDPMHIWSGAGATETDIGAEQATMRTFLLFENNDLRYTAKTAGEAGNNIRVRYIKATSPTGSTTVQLTGSGTEDDPYFITVRLAYTVAEDGEETITSTGTNVRSAIQNHSGANALVEVAHVPGSDGSHAVTEMSERVLIGGFDAVKGKFITEYRLRAIIADGSQIRLSHTGDPHLWSPTVVGSNAVEAYVSPDDGEEISGVLGMGDGGVLIGKPSSLYGLFGYKRENFVIDKLDPNVGVASHRSMKFSRPHGYFVSWDGVYRVQPGGVPEMISRPIKEYLDEHVDFERMDESVAFMYERMYMVSIPGKEGTVVFGWHTLFDRPFVWTEPSDMSVIAKIGDVLHFGKHTETGIYEIVPGSFMDYATDPVEAEVLTLELDANHPEVEKDIGELYVICRIAEEDYDIFVDVYVDGKLVIQNRQATITGVNGRQFVVRVPVGKTARFMEVAVKNDLDQQLSPMSIYYTHQTKETL